MIIVLALLWCLSSLKVSLRVRSRLFCFSCYGFRSRFVIRSESFELID